jgi:hypothetical protein
MGKKYERDGEIEAMCISREEGRRIGIYVEKKGDGLVYM